MAGGDQFPTRFVLGERLPQDESRYIEYKELKGQNPCSSIVNTADNYAVAFLNSEGGRIYWGITDREKEVVGVLLSSEDRDRLRREVSNKLRTITPPIDPILYRVILHPVENASSDVFVVELRVPGGDVQEPYFTSGHDSFVRVDGANHRLSGPYLSAWIKRRIAATNIGAENVTDLGLLSLAARVRKIFSGHGLLPGHLARFFELRKAPFAISFTDQQNDAAFLRWLNEDKIAWIAATFGIRREWIAGEDNNVYEWCSYDKRPAEFFADVSRHTDALIYEDTPASPEAWFLRFGVGKDWERKGQNGVFVIIRVPLARLSNETIVFRYLSDFQPYDWTEGRTAVQLRAWARLLDIHKRVLCVGREVPYETGQEIWGNTVFLHGIFESPDLAQRCRDDWQPEDYALYSEESAAAKPDAFFPHVIEFLRKNGLPYEQTQLFHKPPEGPS